MRVVIPDRLWLGNAIQARDVRLVLDTGITAIVDLAIEEKPIQYPRDVVYCRFPLIDGEGNSPSILGAAIQTTAQFIKTKTPTLVACSAGMSRSPAIIAAALTSLENASLHDTLVRVVTGRPHDVSPALLQAIDQVIGGDR